MSIRIRESRPSLPAATPHRRAAWSTRLVLALAAGVAGFAVPAAEAGAAARDGGATPAARAIESARASGRAFQSVAVFQARSRANAEAATTRAALRDGLVLALDQRALRAWLTSGAGDVVLALPGVEGGVVELELTRSSFVTANTRVVASSAPDETVAYQHGLHYWGVVKGDKDSVAAVSVFGDEVMGLYRTSAQGTFVLGRLGGDNRAGDHVLYAEKDLTARNPFTCTTGNDDFFDEARAIGTVDERLAAEAEAGWGGPEPDAGPGACVKIYVEADYDLFQNKGSVTAVVNYLTGLFNQSGVLYQNESVPITISEIFVWSTPSPYTGNDSSTLLAQFQSYRTTYNGDLGHLVALRGNGGIAAGFSGFCNANRAQSQCFSGIHATYQNVPTYSWSVMVVTHEMGHLMGSRHTHACVWNGNNTAIDGCSGFTEGGCPLPGNPPGGGTIMSYCHQQPVGINFNNGFGPQPGNVIRTGFANASCIVGCGGAPPAAPSGLTATAQSSTSVLLNWTDNSNNETNFEIQRRVAPSGTFALIATLGANVTSYTNTGLSGSTSYEYRVRAKNANGASAYSNVAAVTTPLGVPAAPSGAVATPLSSSTMRLNWTDNSNNEANFEVQRRLVGGTFATVATLGANVTQFNDSGLTPVTTYEYRVRAKNAAGNSAWSNTASGTTQQITVNAPSGLTATWQPVPANIRLNWVDNSNNETGFHLQFSYSGSAWSDLSPPTVGANVTTYTTGSNPPTGSYQFRVRAFSGSVYSNWSNTASVIAGAATASIAWIKKAEDSWGPAGTLTAAGFANNGSGNVQLVWRERSDAGVWGSWTTVAYQAVPAADGSWSNTISSGNPTNACHWFDAYVNYSGITSATFHYTGAAGCP